MIKDEGLRTPPTHPPLHVGKKKANPPAPPALAEAEDRVVSPGEDARGEATAVAPGVVAAAAVAAADDAGPASASAAVGSPAPAPPLSLIVASFPPCELQCFGMEVA